MKKSFALFLGVLNTCFVTTADNVWGMLKRSKSTNDLLNLKTSAEAKAKAKEVFGKIGKAFSSLDPLKNKAKEKLISAIKNDDLEETIKILKDFPSLDINEPCDKEDNTLLHLACTNKSVRIIKYLLGQPGITPYVTNNAGEIPLTIFSQRSSFLCVKSASSYALIPGNYYEIDTNTADICTAFIEWAHKHNTDVKINDPLIWFAVYQKGREDLLKYLVEHGADVTWKDAKKGTVLNQACAEGKIEIVRTLIALPKIDQIINERDGDGRTPLHTACETRNIEIVKLLLNHRGVELQDNSKKKENAMGIACKNGDLEILKLLLTHKEFEKFILEFFRQKGLILVHEAIKSGNKTVLNYILEQLEAKNISPKASEMAQVCIHAEATELESLIEVAKKLKISFVNVAKAPVEYKYFGEGSQAGTTTTLLHYACERKSVQVLELLLRELDKEQVNIMELSNSDGRTILYVVNGDEKVKLISQYLRKNNIKPTLGDGVDVSDFLFRIIDQNKVELLKCILSTQDSEIMKKRDSCGNTLLQTACKIGYQNCVYVLCNFAKEKYKRTKELIEVINAKNDDGMTALLYASKFGYGDVVRVIFEIFSGSSKVLIAILTAKNQTGDTPMHLICNAVDTCHKESKKDPRINFGKVRTKNYEPSRDEIGQGVRFYVDCVKKLGGSVSDLAAQKNDNGDTALHIACRNGDDKIAEMLLELPNNGGAVHNKKEGSPLHIVCKNGDEKMLRTILASKYATQIIAENWNYVEELKKLLEPYPGLFEMFRNYLKKYELEISMARTAIDRKNEEEIATLKLRMKKELKEKSKKEQGKTGKSKKAKVKDGSRTKSR